MISLNLKDRFLCAVDQNEVETPTSPTKLKSYRETRISMIKGSLDFFKEKKGTNIFRKQSIIEGEEEFEIFSTKKFSDLYTLMEKIGEGGSAVVKKVTNKLDGKIYAAKVIRTRDPEYLTSIKNEYSLLKKLDHPNIIKAYDLIFDEESGFVYIILEHFQGKTLDDHVVLNEKLYECETVHILKQVLAAVKFLHDSHICHRDITPNNILISDDNEVKIIDFNISRKVKQDHEPVISSAPSKLKPRRRSQSICKTMLTPKGTLEFQAPEILLGSCYDHSIDMWSIGVTTFYCLMGYRPFHSKMIPEMIDNIVNCRYTFEETISYEARMFIKNCLTKSSFVRMSSKEAVVHPWIRGMRMKLSDYGKAKKKRTLTPERDDLSPEMPALRLRKISSEIDL
jgi:calcium-dependent protein kinase